MPHSIGRIETRFQILCRFFSVRNFVNFILTDLNWRSAKWVGQSSIYHTQAGTNHSCPLFSSRFTAQMIKLTENCATKCQPHWFSSQTLLAPDCPIWSLSGYVFAPRFHFVLSSSTRAYWGWKTLAFGPCLHCSYWSFGTAHRGGCQKSDGSGGPYHFSSPCETTCSLFDGCFLDRIVIFDLDWWMWGLDWLNEDHMAALRFVKL